MDSLNSMTPLIVGNSYWDLITDFGGAVGRVGKKHIKHYIMKNT